MARVRWWWQRWRAAHYTWLAYLDWYERPTQETWERWKHAMTHQDHVRLGRP